MPPLLPLLLPTPLTLPPAPPRPFALLTLPAAAATVAEEPMPKSEPQCPVPVRAPLPAPTPPGPPDPGDPDSFCFFTPQHPAAILEQSAPTHRFRPITVTAGRAGGNADQTYKSHCAETCDGQHSTFTFCFFLSDDEVTNIARRLQCHSCATPKCVTSLNNNHSFHALCQKGGVLCQPIQPGGLPRFSPVLGEYVALNP